MKAGDIMTRDALTVTEDTSVDDIAAYLLEHHISALPILNAKDELVGIVSEGDLIRRPELGTQRRRNWWLRLFSDGNHHRRVADYIRSHGRTAADVMTRNVIAVNEETPAADIAELLEANGIKRVPVLRGRKVVGIVSRANLVQALAAIRREAPALPEGDTELRERVLRAVREAGIGTRCLNVIAAHGHVEVWGSVSTKDEQRALRLAAESVVPADRIAYHLSLASETLRHTNWVT